ncbi:MAG: sulfatase-like hydrolase/transferase, partial [Rhodospirillales bacterium]
VIKNPVAAFAAMLTHMDEDVGRILDLLSELGVSDDTLVMFTSDNGPHKEGGHKPDFFDSNGPLKGYKRDLYEGGIRVATLARWSGKIKPGSKSSHVAAGWDLLPTVCELAGIKSPKGLDGVSFAPTLLGQSKMQKKRDYLYWEFHERGGKQAVRMGKWKGIRLNVRKNPNSPIELYDLSKDIGEENNLAGEYPQIVKKIEVAMRDSHIESDVFTFLK